MTTPLRLVIDRLRAMESRAISAASLGEIAAELELLESRYEIARLEAMGTAKRHLADLEELHVANRLGTVGTLTAGMAHELGTPLGVVLARAQMIAADDGDLTETRQDAEEIIRQVRRMSQMCREVLDFARPKPPTRDLIEVAQLLRQMVALVTPEARKRSVKLVLVPSASPAIVVGDASKLMQVLTNLAINAAQAMPNGGIVEVRSEIARVRPPAEEGLPEGDYLCVHVQDTGTGILPADLAHVFETFFTTKKTGEGTGLGLAISERIVREHAGWIGVVTDEGQGSTFTVYLPPRP